MQVISDTVDKVSVKLTWLRVSALELLDIIIAGISEEGLFLVLGKQSWNLTSREDHVDKLQKFFLFDFGVSEDKAAVPSESASDLKVLLDVLL